MMTPPAIDERVLLLPEPETIPTTLTAAGLPFHRCATIADLCREAAVGAGAVLLADDQLTGDTLPALVAVLSAQPPWSDLPVLVLPGEPPIRAFDLPGDVRVLPPGDIVPAVRAALRARRRQYAVRDRLRAGAEFVDTLAHDLRNPVAPVRNALHVLRMRIGNDPSLTSLVDIIDRSTGQLLGLLDNLLDLSRLQRGKIQLRRAAVGVEGALVQAAEGAQRWAETHGLRLIIRPPVPPLTIEADAARLDQVLTQLLHNACKFTEPGGTVTLSARRDGDAAVLSVHDTGIGIDPAALPTLFDEPAPADQRAPGGLGVGLRLVKALVDLHGGTVTAHSRGPGYGSEFLLRLPIATGAALPAESPAKQPPAGQSPKRLRILVVEDNLDGAQTLEMMLSLWGYQVHVEHDGPAGLRAAVEHHPDVVLLDIGLPGMSGYEVAERLRRVPAFARVPLLAITGYGRPEDMAKSRAAGFDRHLVKPVDTDELRRVLAAAGPGRAPALAGDGR